MNTYVTIVSKGNIHDTVIFHLQLLYCSNSIYTYSYKNTRIPLKLL